MLYYHYFCLVPKHFYLSKGNSYPLSSCSPFSPATPGDHQSALSLWIYLEISCKWNHTNVPFCVGHLSVNMMFSRFIHIVAWISTYSFLWNIIQHYSCMNHICLSIHWWTFEFSLFLLLRIVLLWTFLFKYLSINSGSYNYSAFNFCKTTKLFIAAETFYVTTVCRGYNFSIFLSVLVIFCFCDYSHPHRCEWYLIVVEIFIVMMLNISSYVCWPLVYLL